MQRDGSEIGEDVVANFASDRFGMRQSLGIKDDRTLESCGAPRLVTIGGKSTTVEVSTGALAGVSAGFSGAGAAAGRNASKAAPAQAARQITIAISISDPRGLFAGVAWAEAESDMSAPARMA